MANAENSLVVKVIPTLLTKEQLQDEIYKLLRDRHDVDLPWDTAEYLVENLPMIITVEESAVEETDVG